MRSSTLALLASPDETGHSSDALVIFSLKDNMIIEFMQPLRFRKLDASWRCIVSTYSTSSSSELLQFGIEYRF